MLLSVLCVEGRSDPERPLHVVMLSEQDIFGLVISNVPIMDMIVVIFSLQLLSSVTILSINF